MASEHRLHPYSILFAFATQLRLIVVPGVLLAVGVGRGGDGWWRPWMLLLIIPNALLAIARYRAYRYQYSESELIIRSGVLVTRERHIPYNRIQNVDAVQNVWHRALGVVEVKLDTGGGEAPEATISVLSTAAAAELRERVFAARQAPRVDEGKVPLPLLQLGVRELMLCGLLDGRGAVLVAAAFGVIVELGLPQRFTEQAFGSRANARRAMRSLTRGLFASATASLAGVSVLLALAALLLVLTLLRVLSMVWAVIRLYGFRLHLSDDSAHGTYGLLTRVTLSIPRRRIQALTVREGPLHRACRRTTVKVDTAGGQGSEHDRASRTRELIAPILKRVALLTFVQQLIDVDVATAQWNAPHPRAFRREVVSWLLLVAVVGTGLTVAYGWQAAALYPLLLAWAIVTARQRIKHLRWAEADDAVLFASGWLWRRVVVVRQAKIQVVSVRQTPFDRRHGMASLHVDTAGASAGSTIDIPYLSFAAAHALRDRLSAAAGRSRFTW